MRYLITGIGGFAGTHLARFLTTEGHEVFGLTRTPPSPPPAGLAGDAVLVGDVRDAAAVTAAVNRYRPNAIFHVAGQSSVSTGEAEAASTFGVNTIGTLEVLAAASRARPTCRVVVVSSGECYGRAAGEAPVAEETPLRPVSIYAASKTAAEVLVRQAVDARGVDALCVRAFNHTGPGQSPRFVCSAFARQIVAVERGRQKVVRVGNLDAVRDFLDVRDVVRAYLRACEQGECGAVYNVSSGVGRRIADVLDDLRRLSPANPEIEPDPERLRPAEVPVIVGDSRRMRSLGWEREIDWTTTLTDLLEDWRARE